MTKYCFRRHLLQTKPDKCLWKGLEPKSEKVHRPTKRNKGREREWMPGDFPAATWPWLFGSWLRWCPCVSDAPQGAPGSHWQQCGRRMSELFIWWLWYWGDWLDPNTSGCNLPSCGRPLSCTSRVPLHIVGFADFQIFPQLREGTRIFTQKKQ